MFNDDIQGTGSVTLAGVFSAARFAGKKLSELTFVCAGAGSAGLGVCDQIVKGMVDEGLTVEEARRRFVVCTVEGALGSAPAVAVAGGKPKQTSHIDDRTRPWVNSAVVDGESLLNVVKQFKPLAILGLTATPNVFTEELIRTMAANCEKPIIMPMSNPTSRAECTAEEAYLWTDGRAIVATGSPFGPVTLPDGRVFVPSQCNNMYIFPGLGLAASLAGIDRITDKMLFAAAVACAESVTEEEMAAGSTFPHISRIREVSHAVGKTSNFLLLFSPSLFVVEIFLLSVDSCSTSCCLLSRVCDCVSACAVIRVALEEKLTTKITPRYLHEGIEKFVARKMYFPKYVPLVDPR